MPRINSFENMESYRGYRLGWIGTQFGYRAAWRSSLDKDWQEGCILVDDLAEVPQLARDCIDFNYSIQVREVELGRRLSMAELIQLGKDLKAES